MLSSIQYLSGYSLQTLKIDDESSEFLKTLDSMSSCPTDLSTLELSGMLLKLPTWIDKLNKLVKLTLSATALQTDNLKILSNLGSLFSLTFSISEKQDPTLAAIFQKNISESGGQVFFFQLGDSGNSNCFAYLFFFFHHSTSQGRWHHSLKGLNCVLRGWKDFMVWTNFLVSKMCS